MLCVQVARRCGVQVVVSKQRGRGAQMNAGAQAAASELLCFVHADSFPPTDLVGTQRIGTVVQGNLV